MADVKSTAELYLIGESPSGSYWRPKTDKTCEAPPSAFFPNGAPHNGGMDIGYFDGHVKWNKQERVWQTDALVSNYLPWANQTVYPPGW